jgi:hypothetical protein
MRFFGTFVNSLRVTAQILRRFPDISWLAMRSLVLLYQAQSHVTTIVHMHITSQLQADSSAIRL